MGDILLSSHCYLLEILDQTDRFAGALSWSGNQLLVLHISGRFLLTAFLGRQKMSMYSSYSQCSISCKLYQWITGTFWSYYAFTHRHIEAVVFTKPQHTFFTPVSLKLFTVYITKCVLRPLHNECQRGQCHQERLYFELWFVSSSFQFYFFDIFKHLKILKAPMLLYLSTTSFICHKFRVLPTECYVFLKYLDQTHVTVIEWREECSFLSDLNLRIRTINLTKGVSPYLCACHLLLTTVLLGFSVQEVEGQICAQL